MARRKSSLTAPADRDDRRVVPLGVEPETTPSPRPSPPGFGHGLAIGAMALSALVGIVAMFLFIIVSWPADLRRYVVGVLVFSVLAFLSSAAIAIFTAARDTYARGK